MAGKTGEAKAETIYIVNALSMGMFPIPPSGAEITITIRAKNIDIKEARELLQGKHLVSYIGHEATARALRELLSLDIAPNRAALTLPPGRHKVFLFQIVMRLPEGVVLSREDLLRLYDNGMIKLLYLDVTVS